MMRVGLEARHVGLLQLRVIDGIRTRVVQVEERDGRRPVRVGSAAECDIRVGAGAPVLCELFVHRGRWVVKKSGESSIYIRGKVVSSGAYLNSDDRITLGESEDSAVIEVGPVGVTTAAGGGARPTGPDAIPELATAGDDEGMWLREDADEMVPLNFGSAGGGAESRSRLRRPRRASGGAGWTFVLTALFITGGGAAIWKFRPQEAAPVSMPVVRKETPRVRTTAPATAPTREHANIFDAGWQPPVKRNTGPADSRKQHEDWVALTKAVNGPSPARAIYAIHAYWEKHPRQFEAELQGYLDEAMDRIWWQRIKELCDRRDELKGEIQQLSDAIAEETEEAFREKLEEQRAAKEGLLRWELEMLTKEMGWVGKETPNVADEEMIRHSRGERDSALYGVWKGNVMTSVAATRGYLPWERAR